MIAIIRYSLQRKFTDKATLINMIILPLLLIVILGNALAPTFHTSSGTSGSRTKLVVVDLDNTPASAAFLAFLGGLGTTFTVSTAKTLPEGHAALASKTADVLLSIDPGYGAQQAAGGSGSIELSAVDSNIDHLRAAQIAVDSFSDASRATAVAATVTAAPTRYVTGNYSAGAAKTAGADPAAGVSGITYYSVTMLILILIYGMATTMNYIKEEYEGPLGDRYLATPTSKFTLIGSQVVSGVISSMVQALILVLTSVFVFRAEFGSTPWAAGAIIAVAVLLFNSVGLLLGLLGRTRPWLDPVVSLLIPAMTFLGGGFVKLDFGGLEKFTVNQVFQNGLFREISGAAVQWRPMYVCLAVAGASLLLSAALLNRTEAR